MRKSNDQRALKVPGEHRGDDRMPVDWAASVTLDDVRHSCTVLDVSLAGVRLECDAEARPGDQLMLFIPSLGTFAGTVRWVDKRVMGISLMAGPDLLLKRVAENREAYPDLGPRLDK